MMFVNRRLLLRLCTVEADACFGLGINRNGKPDNSKFPLYALDLQARFGTIGENESCVGIGKPNMLAYAMFLIFKTFF